jgi:large subunit ribosomal protein L29
MKASDIREKETDALLADVEALRKELFQLRLGYQTGSVANAGVLRNKRKDIARLLTVIREREIAIEIAKREANANG